MAGIRTENKIYEVGIYCRLSKDDGTDNESASIATQKSILTDYVKNTSAEYISFRILRNGVMSIADLLSVSTPSLTAI